MREREPCVYILASGHNGTLYVGVTSHLPMRIAEHKSGEIDGFTKRHAVTRLVYYEAAETMETAIVREKQIKRWRRDWKRNLIERDDPAWNDLAESIVPGLASDPAVARWTPEQVRGDGRGR